ncbi:phage RecT family recombinase [Ancylobacter sp. 3268]|uniref:recombinase RecT n=1 Tax=Ancylobacter sp. 3268 TaxID=2817752 RepID=UPI00285EB2C6|nr:recombinase RecT [Ancylobacter sp. 3268]MDR6954187.1 phage RecT family recombinase [Ancylobacter sp. 3268]
MSSRTTAKAVALATDPAAILDEVRGDIAPLLAENGQSYDRLRSTLMIAIQQEPKILECTADSLRREIMKCAADGLVPDSKEAVLLPYWDSKAGVMLANYQPMVHGVIKRLRELGGVFSIVCKLVYEKDEFILDEADPDSLSHKSDPFSKDRGPVVGGYVVFRDDQKRVMHLETMSVDEFEKVRKASKAPNSPAWTNWGDEMRRKAVLRRGSKYISVDNDKIRALLQRQDDMFDFSQPRVAERVDPFSGRIIEGETRPAVQSAATAAIENKPAIAMPQDRQPAPASNVNSGDAAPRETGRVESDTGRNEGPKPAPLDLPDMTVDAADREKAIEGVTKLLAIGLEAGITPKERSDMLKDAAPLWKGATPEYLHPLLKACVDITLWAVKADAEGRPWTADHAMFVHKVRALLDVPKLAIGKYP